MQTILLIDDDPHQHELFSFYLDEAFGSECPFVSAHTLDEALNQLRTRAFDVIFLDNRLRPHHSYTETIGEITDLSGNCPIYLISAARGSEKLGDYRAHGIVDAIDKFELRQALASGLLSQGGEPGGCSMRAPHF
jgi:CheY-like chemotaxis protein